MKCSFVASLCVLLAGLSGANGATVSFLDAGPDPASIIDTVDAYRAALGVNNGGAPTPFPSGRREISWDGVPDALSAPNPMPPTQFINRGALFSTPGSSVQVSADDSNPDGAAVRFGNINPTYSTIFQTFSPQRLFSPIGSNIVDLTFVVPGTSTPAVSTGFGAIYCDADIPGSTSFEYFDINGASLGTFDVPTFDNGLSFLGVIFDSPVVHRVRIAYGNVALGPNETEGVDVSVMDDFLYGEPHVVPLPPALLAGAIILPLLPVIRRKWMRVASQS